MKPLKRIRFLAGFRLLFKISFKIRPKLKGLADDEIHTRILKVFAQSEQERKLNG